MELKVTRTGLEEKVLAYIEENQEEILNQLTKLVQIDTQNFGTHGNENNGQVYLEDICSQLGLTVDRFTPASVEGLTESPDYLPGRGADQRENLVAVFRGKNDQNGIMLAAHMDTVKVGDPKAWDVSPFSGLIKDGKLYGRGSGDDKFGIIMAWAAIKALKECGFVPDKNVLLGSYCDEEGGGGNGALGLCMKYPCETYVNLDGTEFECCASGGGCYDIDIWSTEKDLSVASVFDVYDGVCALVDGLKELHRRPGTTVRLSYFSGGEGGEKEGKIKLALYTDMSQEEAALQLAMVREKVLPKLQEWRLDCSEFVLRTRYFRYGKIKADSREADIMRDILEETEGKRPTGDSTCLSDLHIFMHYGSNNSFNFGMETGSEEGGGPHQVNEHIVCENLIKRIKQLALFVIRGSSRMRAGGNNEAGTSIGQDEVKRIIRKWYRELKIPVQYNGDFQEYLQGIEISPDITAETYEEKGGEENFLSCLYFCERLKERYEEKGIDLKILYDTLQELFLWTRSCSQRKGKLWLENLWWVKLHLTMCLFRLGRLNFCMGKETHDLPSLCPAKGDPILEVHIPRSENLTREDCLSSFEQARSFFATYFPEFRYQYFTCFSWLLDSKLKELLPPESNIMRFQELFRVVFEEESEETLHYVFGKGTTKENLSEKECRSSLAVKIKERVLNGETFHESYGIQEIGR